MLILTTGAYHELNLNPCSHSCKLSALPPQLPELHLVLCLVAITIVMLAISTELPPCHTNATRVSEEAFNQVMNGDL